MNEPATDDSTCRVVKMRQGALDMNDTVFTYVYNDENKVIKILRFSMQDGSETSYEFKYDNAGQIKQVLYLVPGYGVMTKIDYEYNNILLQKVRVEDYFFPYTLETFYEYDASGRLKKLTDDYQDHYGSDGGSTIFEFTPQGNIAKKTVYDTAGTIQSIFEFTYDEDENIMKDIGVISEAIGEYDIGLVLNRMAYRNRNNMTSVTVKQPNGAIEAVYEITYTKDTSNRITRLQSRHLSGSYANGTFAYNFFYECK